MLVVSGWRGPVRALGIAAIALLLSTVAPASAQEPVDLGPPPRPEPRVIHKVADVTLSRPVALVRAVFGVAFLPLAWPVSAALGDGQWALDVCLHDPIHDLAQRPLGEL